MALSQQRVQALACRAQPLLDLPKSQGGKMNKFAEIRSYCSMLTVKKHEAHIK